MSGIRTKTPGGELTDVISMRLAAEDRQLIEAVAALVPVVPRLTLARIALRIGLEVLLKNPTRALAPAGHRRAR